MAARYRYGMNIIFVLNNHWKNHGHDDRVRVNIWIMRAIKKVLMGCVNSSKLIRQSCVDCILVLKVIMVLLYFFTQNYDYSRFSIYLENISITRRTKPWFFWLPTDSDHFESTKSIFTTIVSADISHIWLIRATKKSFNEPTNSKIWPDNPSYR